MPFYADVTGNYRELGVGRRIREERKNRGWTLGQLASRLGISVASLSAIENDNQVITLDRLAAIGRALDVDLEALLPRAQVYHFHINRREEAARQPPVVLKILDPATGALVTSRNFARPLAERFIGKHIDPLQFYPQPASDDELVFFTHHHHEFGFVLRGELEYTLKTPEGVVRLLLAPGDCIYFCSNLPHATRVNGAQRTHSVHLHYSHGEIDSEYSGKAIYFRDALERTQDVGGKITALRRIQRMSARDFARQVGIGVRRLLEIEQGRKSPSLEFLLRVCREFQKPLAFLLASSRIERPFYSVSRASEVAEAAERVVVQSPASGGACATARFKALAIGFPKREMLPYYVKLQNPDLREVALHEHHGQEFVYVLNGEVRFSTILNGSRVNEMLTAGDSCFVDSAVPHRFAGAGLNPYQQSSAEALMVFWCPLGEEYLFSLRDAGV